jgi:hypothetical protein
MSPFCIQTGMDMAAVWLLSLQHISRACVSTNCGIAGFFRVWQLLCVSISLMS